ncbi:MAG: Putative FMN hydrolase; 5-Amino-6-(5'-phosphoribitylamino)uracil phosphatase, partial [uncultured Rubrobacteraceae bacterium]
ARGTRFRHLRHARRPPGHGRAPRGDRRRGGRAFLGPLARKAGRVHLAAGPHAAVRGLRGLHPPGAGFRRPLVRRGALGQPAGGALGGVPEPQALPGRVARSRAAAVGGAHPGRLLQRRGGDGARAAGAGRRARRPGGRRQRGRSGHLQARPGGLPLPRAAAGSAGGGDVARLQQRVGRDRGEVRGAAGGLGQAEPRHRLRPLGNRGRPRGGGPGATRREAL